MNILFLSMISIPLSKKPVKKFNIISVRNQQSKNTSKCYKVGIVEVSMSKANMNGMYKEIVRIKINEVKSNTDLKFESG